MIDWMLLTILLRKHYKPLSKIGNEVGSDWSHLNRLARGEVNQPKFSVGVMLLDLGYDHIPPDLFLRVKSK